MTATDAPAHQRQQTATIIQRQVKREGAEEKVGGPPTRRPAPCRVGQEALCRHPSRTAEGSAVPMGVSVASGRCSHAPRRRYGLHPCASTCSDRRRRAGRPRHAATTLTDAVSHTVQHDDDEVG